MSLDIKDFLEQFVKPNALKLGGEVAIQDVTSSGGPVVPSTAKLYLPDVETILLSVFDIVDNYGLSGTATYSDDSLWATFTASNVGNISGLLDVNDFYIAGFYNEAEYTNEGGDILTLAYTGNFNFDALNQTGNPDYTAGSLNVIADIDTDTYEVLGFVNLSFKGQVGLDYSWQDNGGIYFIEGIFSNVSGPVVLSFDIEVDVDLDTVNWTIGILPNTLP